MLKQARWMGLAIVGLACAGALAPAAPEPQRNVSSLVAEEIKTCEQAMAQLDTAVRSAMALKPDDARLTVWEGRYIRALGASNMSKAEKTTALEKLLARAKTYEGMADAAFQAAQGTQTGVLDARFRRLEVELALARIKAQ